MSLILSFKLSNNELRLTFPPDKTAQTFLFLNIPPSGFLDSLRMAATTVAEDGSMTIFIL